MSRLALRVCCVSSISLLVLLSIGTNVLAWNPDKHEPQFHHHLDQEGIHFNGGFIQDRDGFLWIATQSGLFKYDGYGLRKRYTVGPGSISSDSVFTLHEDKDGLIWMTTTNGLNKYDKDTDTFTVFKHSAGNPESISHDVFNWANQSIAEDADGVIWVGTQKGLNRYDKATGVFTRYTHDSDNPSSLGSDNIWSVYVAASGTVWVGTDDGLDEFDREAATFTHHRNDPEDGGSLSGHKVTAILEDRNGTLWVGTRKGGLNRLDKRSRSFKRYLHNTDDCTSMSSNTVQSISELTSGELLITHEQPAGLDVLDTTYETFRNFRFDPANPNGLSSDDIMNAYQDRTGVIWVVSFDGGLDKIDNPSHAFKLYRHDPATRESLRDNTVWGVEEDAEGFIWIGTETGLSRYDRTTGTYEHYGPDHTDPDSLPDDFVSGLLVDAEGVLWVMSSRLCRFDRVAGRCTEIYPIDCEEGSTIIEDVDDSRILWIATICGLVKFDKTTGISENFSHDPDDQGSIGNNIVLQIIQDRDGMIWVPTFGGGLDRFDPRSEKVTTHYDHDRNDPESIGSSTLNHVYEDSAGTLWVGTVGGGLNRLNEDGTFKRYKESAGFPTNSVQSVIEDNDGFLWLGTKAGLVRFDPRNEAVKVYTKSDGLQGDDFYEYPSLKTRDGELWVFGGNGVNSFYPDELVDNPHIPPVAITSLRIGGKRMHLGKAPERVREIPLDWRQNFFEFEYTSLNYTKPDKNRYKYKLEGFDREWYEAGTMRFGRYSNLPSGVYTLRIIGSNNDGIWNRDGVSLKVTVLRPLWKTWWAFCLYAVAVLGMLWSHNRSKTRRLRAEKASALAIQKSEARYRRLSENSPAVVYQFKMTRDGTFSFPYVSGQIMDVAGFSAEEVMSDSSTLFGMVHPEDMTRFREGLLQSADNLAPYRAELRVFRNNDVYWIETQSTPEVLPDGSVLCDGFLSDITSRKKAEQNALRFSQALEGSLNEIYIFGAKTLHFVDVNHGGRENLGYSIEELRDLTLLNLEPELTHEAFSDLVQPLRAGSQPKVEFTTQHRRKDGTLYPVEVHLQLMTGGTAVFVAVVLDITERMRAEVERNQLEARLQQSQRMESLGVLAGGVAHDFNNMLGAITGYADMILPTVKPGSQTHGQIEQMLEACVRAKDIVNQILTFSRRAEQHKDVVDIRGLLEEALRFLRTSLPASIVIRHDIDREVPPVLADPTQVHQVIMNLCTNASHAMRSGSGELTVGLSCRQVTAEEATGNPLAREGEYTCLFVRDNGDGIPSDVLDRIFEPFFTTKGAGEGSGMGLATSHGIVDSHGGFITVESEIGVGSVFNVFFPAARGDFGSPPSRDSEPVIKRGNERVLVVDDEALVLGMTTRMLRGFGYSVTPFSSSSDALDAMQQTPHAWDLLVTDQTMPGMDGVEMLKAARRLRDDMPVLIMTGNSYKLTLDADGGVGADAVVNKPFRRAELATAVRQVLDSGPG